MDDSHLVQQAFLTSKELGAWWPSRPSCSLVIGSAQFLRRFGATPTDTATTWPKLGQWQWHVPSGGRQPHRQDMQWYLGTELTLPISPAIIPCSPTSYAFKLPDHWSVMARLRMRPHLLEVETGMAGTGAPPLVRQHWRSERQRTFFAALSCFPT